MSRFCLLIACCAVFSATSRADFNYQSRVQINGGEAVVTTRVLKGLRLAILSHRHTQVIDLDAGAITEIDFTKKTYSVTPFSEWKKRLDAASAKATPESGFKLSRQPGGTASSRKPIGVLNATEWVMDLSGASGALSVRIDAWVGTVPGYEQVRDFTDRLAAKLGYPFAAGLAGPAMQIPEAWLGLDAALKEWNRVAGTPIESTIKITGQGKPLGEVSIELGKFGGGAQPVATFNVPDGFKKVDAPGPEAKP